MTRNEKGQFQPGQSGNPKGREPMPLELKYAKQMTKNYVLELLSRFMLMEVKELQKIAGDKTITTGESIVARICLQAIKHGDHFRMSFLLDRTIGPVRKDVAVTGEISFSELVKRANEN